MARKKQAGAPGRVEQRLVAQLRPHPQAGLLPPVPAAELRALVEDVRVRGVAVPLEVTPEGVVVDGHLRLEAAREAGLEAVPALVVEVADPVEYMLSMTLLRRHLSVSQKAALAVERADYLADREQAGKRKRANLNHQKRPGVVDVADLPHRGRTRDQAARWAGVSPRTIQNAASVKAADPGLFEQIKTGAVKADQAARRVRQHTRDHDLPVAPPLPVAAFDLIYADPPWRLPGAADSSRAVENHYPTMPLAEICALNPHAAEDAVLFLWAVNSLLPEALAVIAAWGFVYVNHFVWDKELIGLGSWNRGQHELLLIAKRGGFRAPPPECRAPSVIRAKRGRHSEKPAAVYELLERMYPTALRLELFARRDRPGWTAWGNQAPKVGK
jgi:N6-adenosine-specific RNA methylase IME4